MNYFRSYFNSLHHFLTDNINLTMLSFNNKLLFRRMIIKEFLVIAEMSDSERKQFISECKNWLLHND